MPSASAAAATTRANSATAAAGSGTKLSTNPTCYGIELGQNGCGGRTDAAANIQPASPAGRAQPGQERSGHPAAPPTHKELIGIADRIPHPAMLARAHT